jgi:4-amino-4-deoxy-L-arabinose transferase-like glycosyltransferase
MPVQRLLILPLLLLAAFLRFYQLDAQSFWNDEGNSARIAERSVDLIIEGAAGDIHPPGYYLLLAAWRSVVGYSEFALRSLSAFAGVILVLLVYKLGLRHFDSRAALFAAFFAAVSPPLIYYSQEARMYELVAMWGCAAFLILQFSSFGELENWRLKISFALVLAAGLYTHYSFAFIIIALLATFAIQFFQSLITNPKSQIPNLKSITLQFSTPLILAFILFLPWLPIALRQLTSWPAGREYLPIDQALTGLVHWLTLGPTIDNAIDSALLIGIIVLLALSLWRKRTLEPVVWLMVPTTLTVAFGLFSATFAKFLIVAVPALCLLIGNGLAAIRRAADLPPEPDPRQRTFRFLQPFILLPIILPTVALPLVVSLNNLYYNPTYQRADYRAIARFIDSLAQPGDAILLNAPNQWEVFTYYHPDTNVFPVATSRPLNISEELAQLQTITANHTRLFVLYWGDAQSDPDRVIESWLNENTFKAYDQWYDDVRLSVYAVPRAATQLQTRTAVTFGDRLTLEGYSLNTQTFSPGDILQLTLFWQTSKSLSTRYKVFVHILGDPTLPPVAQHDGEPGGGLALTTTWQPGQTITDNHGVFLPLDLAPGHYSLVVGLYSVDDSTRLTHPNGDSLFLSTITVK